MINEKIKNIQNRITKDGGGGFNDTWDDGDGGDDNICEFVMTVKSTKRMNVHEFDARFKAGGKYDPENLINEGTALRIYCISKTDRVIKYSILAYRKRFGTVYCKIRTGFWLKFKLKVCTGKSALDDCKVLYDTLLTDVDSTWENFVLEGSWDAVRWAMRDVSLVKDVFPSLAGYVKHGLKENFRDPITQAMITERNYIKAINRLVRI